MNIFILDDVHDRHAFFKKKLKDKHQLFHAYTDKEALDLLLNQTFDLCFFDHDLNCFKTENGKFVETTGNDVAREFLRNTPLALPQQVVVHSSNYAGSMNIISKFNSADVLTAYLPFGSSGFYNFVDQLTND